MRLLQAMLMAAIVATLLGLPSAAALGLLSFVVPGLPLLALATFGGALNLPGGLLAWWTLAFLGSLLYAAFALPAAHN
jgi:hypothetical protein